MMLSRYISAGRGLVPRRGLAAAALALLLPLAACDLDEVLDVTDPDIATPGSLADSSALAVLHAGALSDFALAYGSSGELGGGGANEGQIHLSGVLGDEFIYVSTFPTRQDIDRRDIRVTAGRSDNSSLEDAYRNLHRARRAAEFAAGRYEELAPSAAERSELLSLAGFTYNFFGENYCSGVPFSEFPQGAAAVFGEETPTPEIFTRAIQRFDAAIVAAGSDADMANLARIGKARAQLNRGEFAAAAATVSGVPTDFEYLVFYDLNSASQYNGVFEYTTIARRFAVADSEGGEGLPYRSDNDPRVPWLQQTALNFDVNVPGRHFTQAKYPDRAADIPLATGIEARLIEAEAALQAGGAGYLTILNNLRATAGLAALTDPGNTAGRVDQLFKERAYWLWLTSHRLGDLRRLMRQYSRPEATTFPSGDYFRAGETYGTDKNLPIFVDEGNNPQFDGCLDRNA